MSSPLTVFASSPLFLYHYIYLRTVIVSFLILLSSSPVSSYHYIYLGTCVVFLLTISWLSTIFMDLGMNKLLRVIEMDMNKFCITVLNTGLRNKPSISAFSVSCAQEKCFNKFSILYSSLLYSHVLKESDRFPRSIEHFLVEIVRLELYMKMLSNFSLIFVLLVFQ